MGSTIKEMPEMVRLAHALKVPRVGFFPLIVCYPHVRGEDLNLHKSLYNAYYELTQKEAERLNLMVTMPDPFPDTEADANVPVRGDDLIIKQLPQNYYETLPSLESFLDYSAIETKTLLCLMRPRNGGARKRPLEAALHNAGNSGITGHAAGDLRVAPTGGGFSRLPSSAPPRCLPRS